MTVAQAVFVERLLHGEASAQQSDAAVARIDDGLRRGVGDVQKRDGHRSFDGAGYFVHCVCAQHQALCSSTFQRAPRVGEQFTCRGPVTGVLKLLHLMKIDAEQDQLGRMQAPQTRLHHLVDLPVVGHRGFPTHATDEADGFHNVFWVDGA